ncbi:MAG: sodium/solute symporter [Saprospiraceae bacterium]
MDWTNLTTFSNDEIPLAKLNGAFWGSHQGAIFIVGGASSRLEDTIQWPPIQWNNHMIVFSTNDTGIYQKRLFNLPFGPIAYGAAINTKEGFICAGGMSPEGVRKEVFRIKWNSLRDTISIEILPSLPKPLCLMSGVQTRNTIYLLGGSTEVPSLQVTNNLFSLDLSLEPNQNNWKTLIPWEGPGKLQPLTSIQSDGLDDCIYVHGGLRIGPDQSTIRLNDAYKFNLKEQRWEKQSDIIIHGDKTVQLFTNSAKAIGTADIISVGLIDQDTMPQVILYHTITDTWRVIGEALPHKIISFIPNPEHQLLVLTQKETSLSKNQLNLQSAHLRIHNQKMGWLNIIVLMLYFVVLIILGFYFSSRQKNADDYFKGGKRIPWWAAGLSLYGTGLSAISFMAVPAKTYATDWAYFMTKLPQLLIPIIVGFLFIPFYRKLDITTAYEYLQKRFNLATRLVGSLSFIIFQLGRIGIILFLPAIALNVATGIDIILCILLMGSISLLYTIMGGIEAVIWTDVMQVFILVGGLILCFILISYSLDGGFQEVIEIGIEHKKFEILNMAFDWKQPTFWVVVISGFFSNLITYSTDQTMVQRYLTTKDAKAAKKSIWTNTIVSLSIGWIFFFMGTALFAYYKAHPMDLLPGMTSNDAIFPWYIITQLPNGVSGLLIAGIFAAAMSSLSSSMNSAATAYTFDFHRVFHWKGDDLLIGRLATLVIGLAGISFALLFATMNTKSIWDEFLKIIGLIAGGLGGVFLLGIISNRANGAGALIGLLGSGLIQYFVAIYQPVHFLLYTASGFLSCMLIGYLTSLILPQFNKPIDGLTIYKSKTR